MANPASIWPQAECLRRPSERETRRLTHQEARLRRITERLLPVLRIATPGNPGPFGGGLGGMWKWLLAGALAFGAAPASAQTRDRAPRGAPAQSQGSTPRLAAATLFGLPAENGRVRWPFGLESLTPSDETKALRDQLELVLYFAATQAAEGKVNRVFIDFGLQDVRDLRQLLRRSEGAMHPNTYAEAMRFLDRAEHGLTKLKAMEPSPAGAYP